MIKFKNKKYELFFSVDIVPLQAVAFAGEEFFEIFENLCGCRYRLLSIIKNGEQKKYGLEDDVIHLSKCFRNKLNDTKWIKNVLNFYEAEKIKLRKFLKENNSVKFDNISDAELCRLFLSGFELSVPIAAVSNMLYMFSSLTGEDLFEALSEYSDNAKEVDQNKIYYTQPLRETRYVKILMPKLNGAFRLNKKEENLSTILRAGAYIRADGSALFTEERAVFWNKLLLQIANRIKLSDTKDTLFLLPKEIRQMIATKTPPTKLISERKKLTILFYQGKKLQIYQGNEAERFLEKGKLTEVFPVGNQKVLKGQPASPGKTKGKAVVTNGKDDALASIKKGDILVAAYTSTRYVPAMKKAAAVLTETGGITTHAAVISRELGTPCIIAIKDVTKIIKTGDVVEVDADKGIIKILK
ncbi:MAG: PEP-utilizing enzyme [bacterium]